jgi:hypothetical protein
LGGLVMSRRDAWEIFQPAVGFAQNDSFDASLFEEVWDHVGIITFVSNQLFDTRNEAHAFFGDHSENTVTNNFCFCPAKGFSGYDVNRV